jgi:hypothetical protein
MVPAGAIVFMLALALLPHVIGPVPAMASSEFVSSFNSVYPASQSANNASCQLCHTTSTSQLSQYGKDWAVQFRSGMTEADAFQAIEGTQSDNDPAGALNITEINASAQPGWTPGANNTTYSRSTLAVLATNVSPPTTITGALDPSSPPVGATLVTPNGAVITATPTYTWNAVAGASQYELWVTDSAQAGKVKQWVTADQAGCAAGTGTCSATPGTALAPGAATWWVLTWDTLGYGPWSAGMGFTVMAGTPPVAATLVSPNGAVATATPTYTWNAVAGATWYSLWVTDSAQAGKVKQWVTAALAGCGAGTGTCSYTPSTALASGAATWWIQTWNSLGYGPWSAGMAFSH